MAKGVLLVAIVCGSAVPQGRLSAPAEAEGGKNYLPLVMSTGDFALNQPIWAADSPANPTEVGLFRLTLYLSEPLGKVELQLFADTRYQAWLDGAWVGRGPARFARTLREYDVHRLEDLGAGEHVLAVLVQWSPDMRRSESTRPLLQGALQGELPDGNRLIWRSGPAWKAVLSPAWRSDAALIHEWDLIGYTELLDLNLLPADWNQPGFGEAGWGQAVVVDPSQAAASLVSLQESLQAEEPAGGQDALSEISWRIQYRAREIAFTVEEAVPVTLLDGGTLLPGRAIGELPAGTAAPYNLPFQAEVSTAFTIETLAAGSLPAEGLILLDGEALTWQAAEASRPDVYLAQAELEAGAHSLTFNPPAEGLSFTLSTVNLSGLSLPFQQGNHAGRRLLLAEPASQGEVAHFYTEGGYALELTQVPAYAVLDLGRVTHGRLTAQVSGPAGTVVDIGWDERLLSGTNRPLPYPGSLHSQWNQTDAWVLDGTTRELTTIDARSGRYILVAAWGSGPVRLDGLRVTAEHYPLSQSGTFQSSDAQLDEIWQVGADTALLNMVDAYMDPWRERGQWWGDSYVVDQVNQVAFGDSELLRRGLLLMQNAFPETGAPGCAPHNNGLHMLDYAMLWAHSLGEYARRSGDLEFTAQAYPTLVQLLGHLEGFENPATGLLELPKTSWAETAYIDALGYHSRYGQSTALNALYAATLQKAAEVAGWLGRLDDQAAWQAKAASTQSSLNNWLYLPEQGRYLTNIYDGVAYPPTPQAQAWPLAYGLAPEGESGRVAEALLELLSADPAAPNVGMLGFAWTLQGLGEAGYLDQALSLIKSYYGRLLELGATTWWESFLSNQSYSSALSHGWGGSPTWFLSTYILGARQTAPDEWRLQPAIQALEQASGALPLPQGALQATWQTSGCDNGATESLTWVELEAPPGTRGSVVLLASAAMQSIRADGVEIWAGEGMRAAGRIEIRLGEGEHRIEIEATCAALP